MLWGPKKHKTLNYGLFAPSPLKYVTRCIHILYISCQGPNNVLEENLKKKGNYFFLTTLLL